MKSSLDVTIDTREVAQLVKELYGSRPGYVPEWRPSPSGFDAALPEITGRYLYTILQRLNQVPEKKKLGFLDLLGIQLIPAQAARVPIVFRLADNVTDARLPLGTRVAAPPPPESDKQLIFETEQAIGLASAKLKAVVSLWPGRDEYQELTAAVLAGEPSRPFNKQLLKETPHHIYLAHDTLLALTGKSTVKANFELATGSSEHLDITWEYWDGKVWREFREMRPACNDQEAKKLDSTDGLQESGHILLETDCAETKKTTVNGIEAYWVRGRLSEPLPKNPAQVLPEVETIRLSTTIERPLRTAWHPIKMTRLGTGTSVNVRVTVQDEANNALEGSIVSLSTASLVSDTQNLVGGSVNLAGPASGEANITVTDPYLFESESFAVPTGDSELTITASVVGIPPDNAFADTVALDATKPFSPLGAQPQPGSIFYFSSQEIFSKPKANVKIFIRRTETPLDALSKSGGGTSLAHTVIWEYWNGKEWSQALPTFTGSSSPQSSSPLAFTKTGIVPTISVPDDMAETEVNGVKGLWMRIRLVSGGFGFYNTITDVAENEFTYVITQPPTVSKFLIGYEWEDGPYFPEHVVTYNDFQYTDRTEETKWPGQTFQPFNPVHDSTPALYFGFDKQLPIDRLGILFDVEEHRGDVRGPGLAWEYWDGFVWQALTVDDETQHLRLPGIASFIGPADAQPLARFEAPLYWLRARLKEDGPPGDPTIKSIYLNVVWAAQRETVVDEPIGASTGLANQLFKFRQVPLLPGVRLEVRELAGQRANVEWRVIVQELSPRAAAAIAEMESMLAAEGPEREIRKDTLRLTRDRQKRVTEVWVEWTHQPHFLKSGPTDRHYIVDEARGWLLFGDGKQGRVPPSGAQILVRNYRTGGGLAGNVPARTIKQLLGPIGGVEEVFNPRPAEGGANGESLEMVRTRGPLTLKHRGRALTSQDCATLARQANANVAVARAIPCRDAEGHYLPGWVTIIITPYSADPRPWPTFGLREEVRKFIEGQAPAGPAVAKHIYVTGPDYVAVDVEATVVPVNSSEAGTVETRSRQALNLLLHPLYGGPYGRGWEPARDVFLSDVASVLERVEGVNYVRELTLLMEGVRYGERVPIAEDRVVVAGRIQIKVVQGEA
jgi:hypothetical protein